MLQSLLASSARERNCSRSLLSEHDRDSLRNSKCLLPLDTPSNLLTSLSNIVRRSARLHAQASLKAPAVSCDDAKSCPYVSQELPLVHLCSGDEERHDNITFSQNRAFSDEVAASFEGLGVITKSSRLENRTEDMVRTMLRRNFCMCLNQCQLTVRMFGTKHQ